MSGIAGIIRFDGGPVTTAEVTAMTAAMAYRGPDGIEHLVRQSAGFGHCRMNTTLESLEEAQPLSSEDGQLVLVADATLQNWQELRAELLQHGARLRTRADAELILWAYQIWGDDCLAHIDGDFAFVIWDQRRREAFLARDRMGLKPLFYFWNGAALIFASEVGPILNHPIVPEVPNDGMIAEYLAVELYTRDETLWSSVSRLVGAHRIIVRERGLDICRYWLPKFDEPIRYKTDLEYFEHYRELLADCVTRSARSHLPVAMEVSGGLDSSAVFCLAEQLHKSGKLGVTGLQGYTFASDEDQASSELEHVRALRTFRQAEIHQVKPFMPAPNWFADFARQTRDFPGFPGATMSVALYQAAARDGARISIGGDGGDEWLTGSQEYYAHDLLDLNLFQLCRHIGRDLGESGLTTTSHWLMRHGIFDALPSLSQDRLKRLRRSFGNTFQRSATSATPHNNSWLSARLRSLLQERRSRYLNALRSIDPGAKFRSRLKTLHDPYFDQTFEQADRLASFHGVERRSPMRHAQFVQFAFSTPEHIRMRGETSKFIHRGAFRGLMPDSIIERHDKADYSFVFRHQLGQLDQFFAETETLQESDWIDTAGLDSIRNLFLSHKEFSWPMWALWSIFACQAALQNSGTRRSEDVGLPQNTRE